jgi:hypothetical protein
MTLIGFCESQSIIKITRNAPTVKVEKGDVPIPVKSSRSRPLTNDLRPEIKTRWVDTFCPLWRTFLGGLVDPWDTDNPDIAKGMQACFDAVYPTNVHGPIEPNDDVYLVVRVLTILFCLRSFVPILMIHRLCSVSMTGEVNLALKRFRPSQLSSRRRMFHLKVLMTRNGVQIMPLGPLALACRSCMQKRIQRYGRQLDTTLKPLMSFADQIRCFAVATRPEDFFYTSC